MVKGNRVRWKYGTAPTGTVMRVERLHGVGTIRKRFEIARVELDCPDWRDRRIREWYTDELEVVA